MMMHKGCQVMLMSSSSCSGCCCSSRQWRCSNRLEWRRGLMILGHHHQISVIVVMVVLVVFGGRRSWSWCRSLGREFPVPGLDPLLLHRHGSIDVVQLVVETACVAHRFSIVIPSPQSGSRCLTVCTWCTCSSGRRETALWFDEWPVLAVHLVIQTTCVAQIVTCSIPSPQGSRGCATVYTLSPCCCCCCCSAIVHWMAFDLIWFDLIW